MWKRYRSISGPRGAGDLRPDKVGQTIIYPDSDGKFGSGNTLRTDWVILLRTNLDALFAEQANVFVASDLLWYPVEGSPQVWVATDVLVVLGRPKGYRGSYKQWEEDNVAPQVVFEIWSPEESFGEFLSKFQFYKRHGVEEYYVYNPDNGAFTAWQRSQANHTLEEVKVAAGVTSPALGIRFDTLQRQLVVY